MTSIDIYTILSSKPHNPHYLKRYFRFIKWCEKINHNIDKFHKHHILPKAKDLFPQFASFKEHNWNKIHLTYRQHIIAHHILWKAYGGSQTTAFHAMTFTKGYKANSRVVAKLLEEHSIRTTKYNLIRPNKSEIAKHMGKMNKGIKWDETRRSEWSKRSMGSGNNAFGCTWNHSEETKQKLSEDRIGPNNQFYGKSHSIKTKLSISLSKRNMIVAFDIVNLTNVYITKDEFLKYRNTKYVGIQHRLARNHRNTNS